MVSCRRCAASRSRSQPVRRWRWLARTEQERLRCFARSPAPIDDLPAALCSKGRTSPAIPAYARLRAGIALVPEGRRLFAGMTVRENLLLAGAYGRPGPWNLDTVVEAFPLLRGRINSRAGNLSGGEQQATAIGRALMTNPKLLLLDEVSLGLAPIAVEAVYRSLELANQGWRHHRPRRAGYRARAWHGDARRVHA